MSARGTLYLVAACIVGAATLLYLSRQSSPPTVPPPVPQPPAAPAAPTASAVPAATPVTTTAVETAPTAPIASTPPTAEAAPPADVPPAVERTREELQELFVRALDAEEDEERAFAIHDLATASGPEAIAALAEVLATDADLGNRRLAIDSLRIIGLRGEGRDAVRAALTTAVADEDPEVATHAREALRSLGGSAK